MGGIMFATIFLIRLTWIRYKSVTYVSLIKTQSFVYLADVYQPCNISYMLYLTQAGRSLTFKCSWASLTVFPSFFFFQLCPSFRKFLSILRSNNTIMPPNRFHTKIIRTISFAISWWGRVKENQRNFILSATSSIMFSVRN